MSDGIPYTEVADGTWLEKTAQELFSGKTKVVEHAEENELAKFARNELDRLLTKCGNGIGESCEMQKQINSDILEVVKVFSNQGHSEFSASYALNILRRLLDYKPIQPLTGEDDEWNKCCWTEDDGKTEVFQNRRCSAVFKSVNTETGDVKTTYLDKYAISDNGGITWFKSIDILEKLGLSEAISFPFNVPVTPTKIYIKYTEDVPLGETSDNFVDITGDAEEINKLRKVYDRKFHPEKYENETDSEQGNDSEAKGDAEAHP